MVDERCGRFTPLERLPPANPFTFKAGIEDIASGLVKFGRRWYNPYIGAWTQQDTLDSPLDPANGNRYAYAASDPINGFNRPRWTVERRVGIG